MSVKYRELFVKHLVSYILDPNPEVRQAAAYGCGVMAQFGGPDYANDCKGKNTSHAYNFATSFTYRI